MGNGFSADLHEFEITPQGTALLIAYDTVRRDLAGAAPSRDQAVVQEVDIATGLVLFEWHSVGHIATSGVRTPAQPRTAAPGTTCTPTRSRSTAEGNFIVSARPTAAVYKISRETGRILWRLGGKRSDFTLGPGARFDPSTTRARSPTARSRCSTTRYPTRKHSRAITLALDDARVTATLRSALTHPDGLLSATQGSVQPLPNGNTFVGWGSRRWFTEYDADGKVVLDGRSPQATTTTARTASRGPACPDRRRRRPPGATGPRVRASWNGATGVATLGAARGPDMSTRVASVSAERRLRDRDLGGVDSRRDIESTRPRALERSVGAAPCRGAVRVRGCRRGPRADFDDFHEPVSGEFGAHGAMRPVRWKEPAARRRSPRYYRPSR